MSDPQPTQGELIGSFIKLAQEFAGLAEYGRLMAEQHIRMAQEQKPKNIISKNPDHLYLALQTLSNTGRAIKTLKDSLDEMEKASRITGTEEHKEQSPGLQQGMDLLHILHPGKTENLQMGISKAIQSSHQIQYWVEEFPYNQPFHKETVHRTMVEPILDGLGFTSDRRKQTTINQEYCHWLRNADESIVALLITDYRETSYGPEDADINRLDARQKTLHRETEFDGRFIFTNGMEWNMYYPDGPVEWFIPLIFTLDQPDAFWELFMLSLKKVEITGYPPPPAPDDLDNQRWS